MNTNYGSDKPEPIYDDNGRCIGKLFPCYASQERKLLAAPKPKVPHLRLVTVKGRWT